MQRRQPPRIPPGPLSVQNAEALSSALRDLFALRFTAAAPLMVREDLTGVHYQIDSQAVFEASSSYTFTSTTITYTSTTSNYTSSTNNYTSSTSTYTSSTVNYVSSTVNVDGSSTYNFASGSIINLAGPAINVTANTTTTLSSSVVLTITGGSKVVYETPVEICGYLFYCHQTEDEWTANQDDWIGPSDAGFEAVVYRVLANTDPVSLTGMVAEGDGQIVCLTNTGLFTITIKHEDTNSTAANRFSLIEGADIALTIYGSVICWYDPIDTRWKVLAANVWPPDATTSKRGLVSIGDQEFSGEKTFYRVRGTTLTLWVDPDDSTPPTASFANDDFSQTFVDISGYAAGGVEDGEYLEIKTYDATSVLLSFSVIIAQGTGADPTPYFKLSSTSTNYPDIKLYNGTDGEVTGATGTFAGMEFISGLLTSGSGAEPPGFKSSYKWGGYM